MKLKIRKLHIPTKNNINNKKELLNINIPC